jgi:prepilin-type N-terminal cleavage/methylation domain-containing protein
MSGQVPVNLKQNKPGLTIIELLVAMTISVIVAGVVSAIFINAWRAHISQEDYTELQQKSRLSIDEITNTIKVASGVLVSHTANSTTYVTSADTLVLKTPSIDANNLVLTATDYFIFRIDPNDSTRLQRIVIADPTSARASLPGSYNLNDRMGSLSFTYYDATGELALGVDDVTATTNINIEITSQKVSHGRTISRSIDNRVYLRNKQ